MLADCVVFDVDVNHARTTLWQVLGRPELYPRFLRGISACDRMATNHADHTDHYLMRLCPATGLILDQQLRTSINRPAEQLVFTSVPDNGSWVSVRLHDAGSGQTRVNLVFFQPRLRSAQAPVWNEAAIRAWARDGLARMSDHLAQVPDRDAGKHENPATLLRVAKTMISAGVIAPSRPDRAVRQLHVLSRWGPTLPGGFGAAAAKEPNATAITADDGVVSYADVQQRSQRLAVGLREFGVGLGSKVGVLCRNHGSMVQTLIACGRLGADAVLLNTGLAGQQVEDIVHRHGVTLVVLDAEFGRLARFLPDSVSLVCTDDVSGVPTVRKLIDAAGDVRIEPPAEPGRLVVLTSGTTGTPKGARRPTPKGLHAVAAVLSRIPLRAGERMLVAAPIFHSWGLSAVQVAMTLRANLVLRRRFDARDTLRAIERHRCTAMFAVPVMLQRILDLPREVREQYDTSSLRIVASSGSALSSTLVTGFMDAFGDVLYNFYGSTEVSAASVADPVDLHAAPTTAGRPPLGTRLGILDGDGVPVPPGAVGRIFVGNEMLFDGYTDGAGRDIRDDLMDTGDRGYFDADGRLFVSGRDDEMIVSGGENVFPRPVEEVIAALPQVAEVAVVGVADAEFGQRLVAFVVLRPGAHLDEQAVQGYVHQRLARFSVPREVIFLAELPRNTTGKVLKRLLVTEEQLDELPEDELAAGHTGPQWPTGVDLFRHEP